MNKIAEINGFEIMKTDNGYVQIQIIEEPQTIDGVEIIQKIVKSFPIAMETTFSKGINIDVLKAIIEDYETNNVPMNEENYTDIAKVRQEQRNITYEEAKTIYNETLN